MDEKTFANRACKKYIVGDTRVATRTFDYAVYPAQLISSNSSAYIKVPKNVSKNVVKRYIIMPEQFTALIEKYLFGTPFHMPLLMLYHTGMRLGEVLVLS